MQALIEYKNEFLESSVSEKFPSIYDFIKQLIDQQQIQDVYDEKEKEKTSHVSEEYNFSKIIPHISSDYIERKEEIHNIDTMMTGDKMMGDEKETSLMKTYNAITDGKLSLKGAPLKTITPSIIQTGRNMIQTVTETQASTLSNVDIRRLLVAKMRPFEVQTKDNIAAALLGKDKGEEVVNFFIYKKTAIFHGYLLYFLWLMGHILGQLSLYKIISPEFGAVGAFFTLPAVIITGVSIFIIPIVMMLLGRFDTW